MGFLDEVGQRIDQVRYRDYVDAVAAVSALVGCADSGGPSRSQRQQVAQLAVTNPVMASFPAEELRRLFDGLVEEISADADFGRAAALQRVAKVADRPDQARSAIEVGIEVAKADGYLSRAERAALRHACEAVNLYPGELEL